LEEIYMRRQIMAVVAFAATLVPITAADAQAACTNADKHPSQATVAQLRAATVCLVNIERAKHGRAKLRTNHGLALAGQRHASDMVRRQYFSHTSRSGRDFKQRIVRTGYARGHGAILGENLAWGSQGKATPRSIVRSWMNSPGHRANILQPRFREIGIGVVRASPRGLDQAATYAAEFGRKY
jgi:uncharacterized protein YkwD